MPCWPCVRSVWARCGKLLPAVRAFASLPEAPALAAANKRIGNILKKAGEVDAHVNPKLLMEPAEQDLYAVMQRFVPEANAQFEAVTTPPRCRRWPLCAGRSMRFSTT